MKSEFTTLIVSNKAETTGHREFKQIDQNEVAKKWRIWGSNSGSLVLEL